MLSESGAGVELKDWNAKGSSTRPAYRKDAMMIDALISTGTDPDSNNGHSYGPLRALLIEKRCTIWNLEKLKVLKCIIPIRSMCDEGIVFYCSKPMNWIEHGKIAVQQDVVRGLESGPHTSDY